MPSTINQKKKQWYLEMEKRERLQIIFEMNFPFSFDYCYIHVSQTPKMSGDKIRIISCEKKWLYRDAWKI